MTEVVAPEYQYALSALINMKIYTKVRDCYQVHFGLGYIYVGVEGRRLAFLNDMVYLIGMHASRSINLPQSQYRDKTASSFNQRPLPISGSGLEMRLDY